MSGKILQDPNHIQVGGNHYTGKEKQHWDYVVEALDNRYLEGQITKYLFRYRDKNGAEDLRKSLHYCAKLIKCFEDELVQPLKECCVPNPRTEDLLADHSLSHNVHRVCMLLPVWSSIRNLQVIQFLIEQELDSFLAEQPDRSYVTQSGE